MRLHLHLDVEGGSRSLSSGSRCPTAATTTNKNAELTDKCSMEESEQGVGGTSLGIADWYNNEHVPLRLHYLKSFLSGARYSGSDSKTPSWVDFYNTDDISTFSHEPYTGLRANRSREAALVKRLETLDRRTSEGHTNSDESSLPSLLKSENPTKYLVTHGITRAPNGSDWVGFGCQSVRMGRPNVPIRIRQMSSDG
ncbi:hypothetical protein D9758_017909 [Tetrapyrgos nigripes]|uniref:Uncharacterized protein n=1 Tax=Tetrapyrgos nigripes TaxID=182062 RepID=A0A8H5C270_9AGAR|nr:hypothetical protein D9758_017909 [Tetrapyrgos nigripes]